MSPYTPCLLTEITGRPSSRAPRYLLYEGARPQLQYLWWPGCDGEIEELVKSCPVCQTVQKMPVVALLHPWRWLEIHPWSMAKNSH